MSNEISNAAYFKAASQGKDAVVVRHVKGDGYNDAYVSMREVYIFEEDAAAAQAELDAADEITDAEIEAIARMCELEYPELFAMAWDMGLFARRILTAACKARQA